ncbi:MAG: hypothetical protein SGILL_001404 [Bacillariaceae sp.]
MSSNSITNITNSNTGASASAGGLVPPRNNTRRGLSDATNHHISLAHSMTTETNATTNKRKRSSTPPFMNPDSDSDDEGSTSALNESTIRDQSLMDSLGDEDEDDCSTSGQAGAASGGPDTGGSSIQQHQQHQNKKRRTTIGGAMMTAASAAVDTASSTPSWQAFSRQGTQFKAILDETLVKVATAAATSTPTMPAMMGAVDKENNTGASGSSLLSTFSSNNILQKLAQEKQTDNLLLKQQLDRQKTETATLQALLDDMRSNKHEQAAQITRLTLALTRAAANATQARKDADSAETTAAQLSGTVDALETVVQETKRASSQLLEEQEQVREAAQGMETKFMQAQTDLVRSNAIKHKIEQEQCSTKKQLAQLQESLQTVANDLNEEKTEKQDWKRQTEDLQSNEKIHQTRMDLLEKELQESKKMVSDVTALASETQEAKQKVESALDRLHEVNQQLSDKLQESQQQLKRQDESHNRALAQAQKENQTMKQKWTTDRDLLQSLRVDKDAVEKKNAQLTRDLKQTEQRLLDSTSTAGLSKTTDGEEEMVRVRGENETFARLTRPH